MKHPHMRFHVGPNRPPVFGGDRRVETVNELTRCRLVPPEASNTRSTATPCLPSGVVTVR
jgi:hypothetical protein